MVAPGMPDIVVINGPNLNMLGRREPGHYGIQTLEEIDKKLISSAAERRLTLETFQSNAEHELIERIHQAKSEQTRFIILNPAGFTHTSVALRDAILAVEIPFIEVHLSNIHQRESFRHHSYFSDIASGVIAGLGPVGYSLALDAISQKLAEKQ